VSTRPLYQMLKTVRAYAAPELTARVNATTLWRAGALLRGGSVDASFVMIPVGAEALGNRAYAPDETNVAVGTTVTWMNTDSANRAHTLAHRSEPLPTS